MALAEYTSRQEMIEAHKARLARMAPKPKPAPKVIAIQEPEPEPVIIEIKKVEPVNVTVPVVEPPTLNQILCEVAAKYGLTVNDLKCAGRQTPLILPRFEYCYRAAGETLKSLPEIGKVLGKRDHTTIINGIRRYCQINDLPHPRAISPRAGQYRTRYVWTPERLALLRDMWKRHVPMLVIAQKMGLTKSSVASARKRYMLQARHIYKIGAQDA